jgi:hypothetical protein
MICLSESVEAHHQCQHRALQASAQLALLSLSLLLFLLLLLLLLYTCPGPSRPIARVSTTRAAELCRPPSGRRPPAAGDGEAAAAGGAAGGAARLRGEGGEYKTFIKCDDPCYIADTISIETLSYLPCPDCDFDAQVADLWPTVIRCTGHIHAMYWLYHLL